MGRKARRRGGRTAVRRGKVGGPQIIEGRGPRWADAHERRFLDEIGTHCNVTRAARAVGFSTNAVYARRRNDPAFMERWQAALAQGYVQIEMGLIRRATEALEGIPPDPAVPIVAMTVKEVLSLLQMHRASVTGEGSVRGRRQRVRSLDEVSRSIMAKLGGLAAARTAGMTPEPAAGGG